MEQEFERNRSFKELESTVIQCRRCPRLVAYREEVARVKRKAYRDWDYWGRPVPGFGDVRARILVVGLAPAAHGGNRTGRVFTGDSSGDFLFRALYKAGFANQASANRRGDGLALKEVYIAAVCRCAPPDNKPLPQEIANCLPYLEQEIRLLDMLEGVVALGKIAFDHFLRLYRHIRQEDGKPLSQDVLKLPFAHAATYQLGQDAPWLVASYHPSRQNTQTGRLTEAMFDEVWEKSRRLLDGKRQFGF